MKKLNIISKSLGSVGPKVYKDTSGTKYETESIIKFLKKDKEALEYMDEAGNLETGEDFMFAFENYIKEEGKGTSIKWGRVNWDRVGDYFLE